MASDDKSFFDVIAARRSVRAFRPQKVEPEKMNKLLEAVRTAPTAGNLQAYQIYLIESPDKIKALATAALGQDWMCQASAVLVFCADAQRSSEKYGGRGRRLSCIQDATIAATIAHLAAVALGLGSVFVGAFEEDKAAAVLDAPESHRPIVLLPVGYPNETPAPTDRRPLDDLVDRL
jgi:nitroreductase